MKRERFTDQQVACARSQVEGGTPVADVCRQSGADGIREPRELRQENTRLNYFSAPTQSATDATRTLPAIQHAPNRAHVAFDLVIDGKGEMSREHSVESPQLHMDAGVNGQRVDIRRQRIKKVVADTFAVLSVEGSAGTEVADCGRQNPQLHRLLAKFALGRRPIDGLLRSRLDSLPGFAQGFLVPAGRLVPITLAGNRYPQLLERTEFLLPRHLLNFRSVHRACSLLGKQYPGKHPT